MDKRERLQATIEGQPVDRLADFAGTIGYEILTSLGHRYHRTWQ